MIDFLEVQMARDNLIQAQKTFDRVPGYQNAIALSDAKKLFAHLVGEERASWMVIDGSAGIHNLSPLNIAVAALWEVKRNTEDDGTSRYLNYIAHQALVTLGEIDENQEIQTS